MANGYIRISKKDIYATDDGVFWKNGARYLGKIAKGVLNPGDPDETVTYYLKSAITKKAILIDAGVVVGGDDYYFITDDANFINVRIESADFTDVGGGDGVTVTFMLPGNMYYTVHYVEANGDIKLYDPNGDAGSTVSSGLPDVADASAGDVLSLDNDKNPVWETIPTPIIPKSYMHIIKASKSNSYYVLATIVTNFSTPFTYDTLYEYLSHLTNLRVPASGYAQASSSGLKGSVYSLRYMLSPAQIQIEYIKYVFTSSTPSLTSDTSYVVLDSATVDDNVVEI